MGQLMPDTGPQVLDLKGLKCPLPVLKTRKRLQSLTVGQRLQVETTDPLAVIDIPHMCAEDGHRLISQSAFGVGHMFLIERA
jgi:tRNA 2-thiouridine synthesizing protein A